MPAPGANGSQVGCSSTARLCATGEGSGPRLSPYGSGARVYGRKLCHTVIRRTDRLFAHGESSRGITDSPAFTCPMAALLGVCGVEVESDLRSTTCHDVPNLLAHVRLQRSVFKTADDDPVDFAIQGGSAVAAGVQGPHSPQFSYRFRTLKIPNNYGFNTNLPVVFLLSRSRCASAASRSG